MSERGPSLTIVVRSAGERTEAACVKALEAQSTAPVEVIRERPFLAALRRSVRIGIDAGTEFTLCVDADVILAPSAVARLLERMRVSSDAFFVCGFLMDRYYGEPKARGVHLYRSRFLPEAERALPSSERVERPETEMKEVLVARGRVWHYVDDRPLGLHGYGQYYRDIFRTMACRGQKSADQSAPLMERFERRASRDADLRVALWGLRASAEREYSLDAEAYDSQVGALLRESALQEKGTMESDEARSLGRKAALMAAIPLAAWRALRRVRPAVLAARA